MKVTKEKLLLGLEVLVLCVMLVLSLKPKELVLTQENVSWISENTNQELSTMDIVLPELPAGSYELTVAYETMEGRDNEQPSYLQLRGGEDYFRSLLYNPVEMSAETGQMSMSFYLRDKAVDMLVCVEENDAQLPAIKEIELVRTSGAARMVFCLLLLVLIPLNLLYALYQYMEEHEVDKERLLAWIGVPAIAFVASLPLFTDYLLASTEMEQTLHLIEDVAQSGQWSEATIGLAVPILLRKLGFTLNMAYAVSIFLENVCAAVVAYLICYLCFKKRAIACMGCMLYVLAPWRLENIYLVSDGNLWKLLGVVLIALTSCWISVKILKSNNVMHKNIYFTVLCGGYLLYALAYMNNLLLWTEGIIRLY